MVLHNYAQRQQDGSIRQAAMGLPQWYGNATCDTLSQFDNERVFFRAIVCCSPRQRSKYSVFAVLYERGDVTHRVPQGK